MLRFKILVISVALCFIFMLSACGGGSGSSSGDDDTATEVADTDDSGGTDDTADSADQNDDSSDDSTDDAGEDDDASDDSGDDDSSDDGTGDSDQDDDSSGDSTDNAGENDDASDDSGDDDSSDDGTGGTGDDSSDSTDTDDGSGIVIAGDYLEHEEAADYVWDVSDVVKIVFNGSTIAAGSGVTVSGTTAVIASAGTYQLTGTLTDGKVLVDTDDEEVVRLILRGVDISCSSSAPIDIENAEKVVIVLSGDTENVLTDAANYVFESADEDEPNAALFSKADMAICGGGSLTVNGNYNDGIASKDGLIIRNGAIAVNAAADDGIRGKDYLLVVDAEIDVIAAGDGLKSDNDEDSDRGYIYFDEAALKIVSGRDAVQGETRIIVASGDIDIVSGGGNNGNIDLSTESAKGLKAGVGVTIDGGVYTIDSADDAVHANDTIVINDGLFDIVSGDDGVHADTSLTLNGGDFDISKSYEGIESALITINDGSICIVAADDGLNVAGGADSSAIGGRPGSGNFNTTGNNYLYLNDGYIVITATGDGVDVNGSIQMTGGTLLVNGPTSSANGALDYDGTFKLTGGFLALAGSSGMAMAPGTTSTQCSVLVNFNTVLSAGTLVHFETGTGADLLTFKPGKQYQSILFSSPALAIGSTCNVYTGGSATGTLTDGLYEGGVYTPGTRYTSFTIASVVTRK